MSDLATIRKTHGNHSASQAPACDGCALLAHIDALTAAHKRECESHEATVEQLEDRHAETYQAYNEAKAHIDALTAAVNERFDAAARYMGRRDGMVYGDVSDEWGMTRAAVLAILRGEA